MFIDETSVSTTITRLYGRAPQGERLVQKVPHGNWKTITFIAALRHNRITAPIDLACRFVAIARETKCVDGAACERLDEMRRDLEDHRCVGITDKNITLIRQVLTPGVWSRWSSYLRK